MRTVESEGGQGSGQSGARGAKALARVSAQRKALFPWVRARKIDKIVPHLELLSSYAA